MSKDTFYFSHDYNARNDPRLMRIALKHGMEGIGIYWCMIEMLYEQGGYIPLVNIESIAYELHSQCDRIKDVLQNYDLFKFQDELFYSESVLRRLETRKNKSSTARESALKRWSNANALQTHSKGNAIKGKERKGNIKRNNKRKFTPPTLDEVKQYFKDNNYSESSAVKAYNHYSLANWYDTGGKPVLNWKQKMNTVWFKPENQKKGEGGLPLYYKPITADTR